MKYIYDLLQTCIVPRCCVLSGWLSPDVFPAEDIKRQSETQQRSVCVCVLVCTCVCRGGWGARGMLRFPQVFLTVNRLIYLLMRALQSQAVIRGGKQRNAAPAHNNGADDKRCTVALIQWLFNWLKSNLSFITNTELWSCQWETKSKSWLLFLYQVAFDYLFCPLILTLYIGLCWPLPVTVGTASSQPTTRRVISTPEQ